MDEDVESRRDLGMCTHHAWHAWRGLGGGGLSRRRHGSDDVARRRQRGRHPRAARGRGGGPYESAPLRGGVVGFLLPPLRPSRLALERDDVVVLASDGIRAGFAEIATTRDG